MASFGTLPIVGILFNLRIPLDYFRFATESSAISPLQTVDVMFDFVDKLFV